MNISTLKSLFFILLFSVSTLSFAQGINGNWRTYDDNGQARSIVKFDRVGNAYQGTIVKVIPVSGKDDKVCNQCKGKLKGKPLVGMVIVWGLKEKGNRYVDGSVLDVDTGKTYSCSITLSKDGRTLYFYAHFGPFGKTIDWHRVK